MQNNDLISRKALIEEAVKAKIRMPHDRAALFDLIKQAPAVDAAPVVYGRWETDKEDIEWGNSLKRKHCTNCGKRPHFDKEKREFVLSDFCPHCGAKMDRKDDT